MDKVLIVDDEPNILMSLEFLMKKEGFEVFVARDGAEALEILDKETPKFIILDVMMPNVDGYEVCKNIRKNNKLKDMKIIFISAKSKDEDIEKAYEIGADSYFTKPFSTRELVKKIRTYK